MLKNFSLKGGGLFFFFKKGGGGGGVFGFAFVGGLTWGERLKKRDDNK